MKTRAFAISSLALAIAVVAQLGFSEAATAQAISPEDAFAPSAQSRAARKPRKTKRAKAPVKKALVATAAKPAAPTSALVAMPVAPSAPAPAAMAPSQGITYSVRHAAAIDLALAGDVRASINALRSMLADDVSDAEKNPVRLTLGRVLYGVGDVKGAIAAYSQVTRGSDSWFLALEERAWANFRIDRPDEALASLKTLLLPVFKDRVEAEPYFLASLVYLRVCDYKSVFKTIRTFKERFRDRIKELEVAEGVDPSAKARLKEASETIQKLSLVEAEAIQRLYMPDEIKGHTGPARKIVKTRDEMKFPEEDGNEVWLDEVDGKQVSVKGCPRPGTSGVAGGATSGKGGRPL